LSLLYRHASLLFTARRYATHSTVFYGQLSLRSSVTLKYRDHIGWKSSKIMSRLVTLTCSLSETPASRI